LEQNIKFTIYIIACYCWFLYRKKPNLSLDWQIDCWWCIRSA